MDRRDNPDSKIIYIAAAILIFSVLAFGTVEIWSIALMEGSVFTLILLWLITYRKEPPISMRKEERYMIFTLVILLIYILIQMIPFPQALLKYLSPRSFDIYSFFTLDERLKMSISINTYNTGSEFLRILAYSLFFLLLSFSIKDMAALQRMMKILTFFGFVLAIFAILQKATWDGKLYWVREITIGSPFGPFVNRNHYAGFIDMIIPLSLGLVFTIKDREKQILYGFFSLVMGISIFLSLSRGGIISFFAGVAVFAIFLSWEKFGIQKRWVVLLSFVFALFSYLLYLGIDPIIDRFYETDLTREDRFTVWLGALNAFKDFYLTGSGLGTFINIFPLYALKDMGVIYDHAHSDYLEFILEAGIVGTVLLLLFLFFFVRCIIRGKWLWETGIIRMSIVSSITTMVVHSIFDFNLHIPSNALMLSAIFGMAVASSRMGHHRSSDLSTIKADKNS
jgi:O-antigen ligase